MKYSFLYHDGPGQMAAVLFTTDNPRVAERLSVRLPGVLDEITKSFSEVYQPMNNRDEALFVLRTEEGASWMQPGDVVPSMEEMDRLLGFAYNATYQALRKASRTRPVAGQDWDEDCQKRATLKGVTFMRQKDYRARMVRLAEADENLGR